MDSSIIIPAIAGIAIIIIGIALSSDGNEAAQKRIQSVAKEKETAIKRKSTDPDADRRKKIMGSIKDLELKEKQMRRARLSLSARIEQAGLSFKESVFWFASAGLGAVAALVLMFVGQPIYIVLGGGFAAGFGLPQWILKFLISMRQKKFSQEFAGAIEVIVRGVKSGLPLNECLRMIGRESGEPLGGEFRSMVDQMSMGVPLEQALSKFFERMPLPEVSFFSIVLTIQAKAGGNLSEALSNLANVLRSRKMMREKVNALSSEAKASAVIIGALPIAVCVMVSITSPAYMGLLFSDKTGHMGLMVGAGMMGAGILVMRNMINFEI